MHKSFVRALSYFLIIGLSGWLASSAPAQFDDTAAVPESLKPGFNSITDEQCKEWLSILAGREFRGRGTGQPGYTKAAHWVAGKMAEFGLEPLGAGGSYFQMLPMSRRSPDLNESKITGPDGLEITGPEQLGFTRYSDQPQVTGQVVFVSVTGNRPEFPDGVDLRDKIVIYTPGEGAGFRTRFILAREGPAAIVTMTEGQPETRSEIVRPGRRRSAGIWCSVNESAGERLLETLGAEPSWTEPPEEEGIEINQVESELTITVRLVEQQLVVPNVVAWLEGSDPELKDEYIVLGAHLDHLGERGDEWYPGADDNGSGSTAVLSVARAMSLNPVKPKRSVLFIWFAAEEIGLVGSRYYVDNPAKPLDKAICMFNTDMVGRNEEVEGESASENRDTIHLVGSKRGNTDLHDVILEANQYVNFRFEYDEEDVFGRSDQASFYRATDIPVAFLFGGFHPDYHQPTDKVEKINYHKITSAARLFYMAIYGASEHGPFQMEEAESAGGR